MTPTASFLGVVEQDAVDRRSDQNGSTGLLDDGDHVVGDLAGSAFRVPRAIQVVGDQQAVHRKTAVVGSERETRKDEREYRTRRSTSTPGLPLGLPEALLQLLGEAGPAAVDGIPAPVLRRSQNYLVVRILQRLPLQLAVRHAVQHAAERLVLQQVADVVDSWRRKAADRWTQSASSGAVVLLQNQDFLSDLGEQHPEPEPADPTADDDGVQVVGYSAGQKTSRNATTCSNHCGATG
ncbi:hypothetical protein EYF80_003718 [Liparis tanakae]|uniref:Uncharacterized protein n=1 Tax=Liparis tanakae TaxID=230148 RepID=A0A4Z2J7I2_9TELE|nr:hypothetical protein EYF80_003718 [Liparis tanakae]